MSRTLSLSTKAFSPNVFLPVKLSGAERINELFCYQLIVKTPNLDAVDFYKQFGHYSIGASADLTALLGQNLTVGIEIDGKEVTFSQVNNTFRQYFTETVGKGTRYISGIITSARYLYNNERSSYYSIELRPFLYNATLKSDYKIFQNKNVIEILDEVLSVYSGTVEKRLFQEQKDRYPSRIYQNQHGETDYQFFCRLCSEWGINFYWNHTDNNHTLILSDDPYDHRPILNEAYQKIAYYPLSYNDRTHVKEEHLHEFNLTAQMVSSGYISADYDYARASEETLAQIHNIQPYPEAEKNGVATRQDDKEKDKYPEIAQYKDVCPLGYEIYEYAADLAQPQVEPRGCYIEEHRLRNQWNLERIQQGHFTAKASGHIRGITTGYSFELEKHPNKLANIHWTVLGTELLVMDVAEETQRKDSGLPSLLSMSSGGSNGSKDFGGSGLSEAFYTAIQNKLEKLTDTTAQGWRVECSADLIPANIPIRPPKIDKPKASLQNALVVGEAEGGALYLDAYGRIKIQFYWDRYGTRNENSSCWVRVNEPWAGNQMGAVFTPRIGSEVLIDFVNNDPDLPVCIGKVNNSNNMPNWALAQNKALSGFRSREMPQGNSASGRSNHLVFDDSAGNIQTQLKSDHAHSQLSLGDITRIEDNAGRKDGRGQGFELRTDDWGATRAAKGLYLTTFPRDKAQSTHMDAFEAQQLLEEARQLVKQMSKLANQHQAEPLSGTEPLGIFSKLTQSELPDSINSVLSDSLPDKVKAQVSENILKNLAKQEAIPPLEPISPSNNPLANSNNIGDLISQYARDQELYRDELKAFANNPYDKAKQKLAELEKISDPQEKAKALLKDQEIIGLFQSLKNKKANAYYGEQDEEIPAPYSPKGFAENILVGAGEAGIALVTPKDTHQYSGQKHTITAGQDLNVTTGQSWLASIQNKMSFFVQQGIKIFSGKGKIQIQANSNNVEIIADKTVKVISANDKVEVIAKKEILITCRGAYIRLKDGNIEIHAPGKIEQKAAVHPFMGPTSLPKEMPRLPTSELNIKKQFSLNDTHSGVRFPFQNYKITLEDGTEYQGKTNARGETEPIESHIPQKALVQVLDNKNNEPVMMYQYSMVNGKEGYVYEDNREALPKETLDGQEIPKNHSSNTEQSLKPDAMNVPIYSFGMRKAKFKEAGLCSPDGSTGSLCPLAGYPVVEQYHKAMGRLLDEFPWGEMFPEYVDSANAPLGDDEFDAFYKLLTEQITVVLKEAISSPLDADFAVPEALFPEMKFTTLDASTGGNFIASKWKMNFPTDTIEAIARAYVDSQKSGTQSMRENYTNTLKFQLRNNLIDVFYHEVRHCQQHFWLAVYMEGFAKDFVLKADPALGKGKDTLLPQNVLLDCLKQRIQPEEIYTYIQKNIKSLSQAIKNRPYNQLALKRLAVCMLYTTYFHSEYPAQKDSLERLSRGATDLLDKLAAQTFKNSGRNGRAIDYTLFAHAYDQQLDSPDKRARQHKGYRLQPHEDDAYATGDILSYYVFLEHKGNPEFPYYGRHVKTQKLPLPTDFAREYPG